MKLLLDTHIWIWSVLQPENLTARVAEALENPSNELWLSPLSLWELFLAVEKRRLALKLGAEEWVMQTLAKGSWKEAPLTYEVVMETRRLHLLHRDPVDLFLAATARVYDLTLVTSDERLIKVKGLSVLANR